MIDVAGMPTTGGGPASGATVASRDAAAIANLRRSGAQIVGKTNLYEWGYGVSSENIWHGPVRNPRALDRSAGGSSSGSAAAVAAGLCDWAVGTDTAGSVRIPASLCGIVGFKPSYEAISREGVAPLSPSQDTVGILAPSVAVATAAASGLADDATFSGQPEEGPFRLAVPEGWVEDLDPETSQAWRQFASDLPPVNAGPRAAIFQHAQRLQSFEAARVHADALRETPERFHPDVRARLEQASDVTEAEALESKQQLSQLAAQLETGFEDCDALVLPTTACVAPPLVGGPDVREALTRFTRPFNGTGQPAISLPLPVAGLPVGIQLVGRRGADSRLLAIAQAAERALAAGRPLGPAGA